MAYFAGIDVSLKDSSICVVDADGKIVREAKLASEPEALVAFFGKVGFVVSRIGLEAGPLVNTGPNVHQHNGLMVHQLAVAEACP